MQRRAPRGPRTEPRQFGQELHEFSISDRRRVRPWSQRAQPSPMGEDRSKDRGEGNIFSATCLQREIPLPAASQPPAPLRRGLRAEIETFAITTPSQNGSLSGRTAARR
jgi:hypothetical protein